MKNQSLSLLQILQEASAKEILASLQRKYPKRLSDVEAVSNSGNPPATWPTIMKLLDKANEPVQEVLSLVAAFNKARAKLPKKDLSLYDSLAEVQIAIESIAPSQTSIRNDVKGQVEKIYEDDNFVVVYPHSKEASCVWGKGTTWCTARTQSTNYFPYYAGAGNKLYYLITKGVNPQEDPNAKMSIGFGPNGKFSGGQDGGLSVNANNRGITWTDVIEQLKTKEADVRTRNKIIDTITAHASSSGDHPLKGYYEKATQDPVAHRRFFDDAMNGVSPEPYVALLVMSDARNDEQFYPLFFFDMCVYLNELLKKYGPTNEAFGELATMPSLYTMNGWIFPDDINQGELAKYIQNASWLLDLGFSKLESYLKTPVVKFVNSIPVALHMIETGNLEGRELRLIYNAKFLNQKQFHQVIRENALDMSLDPEARDKYQQIIELFAAENFDTHTEVILFSPDSKGTPDSKLSAWFFQVRSIDTNISPQTLNKVITQFILPNLETLIKSGRSILSKPEIAVRINGLLGWDADMIDQTYYAVAQLLFALGFEQYPVTGQFREIADRLLARGIMNLDSSRFEIVQRILNANLSSNIRRREAMSTVSDVVDYVNTDFNGGDVSLVHEIMRKLAEIARRHDTEYEVSQEMPTYASRWWTSPYLPPEYVSFKANYRPEDPNNPFMPWPPPDLTNNQPMSLAEMLFR